MCSWVYLVLKKKTDKIFCHKTSSGKLYKNPHRDFFYFSLSFFFFPSSGERRHLLQFWIFLSLFNFTAISTFKWKLLRIYLLSHYNKNCPNNIFVNLFSFILQRKSHLQWIFPPLHPWSLLAITKTLLFL